MLPPIPEEPVPRKQRPKPLDILLGTLIEARVLHNLLRLLGLQREVPLARRVLKRPLLYSAKIPARVRGREAGEYAGGFGDVDVEGDRRDVGVAHEGLAERVDAVVWWVSMASD